jgi:SAM-dependent methyltransferase
VSALAPVRSVVDLFEAVLPTALGVCPTDAATGRCVFEITGEGGGLWSIDLTGPRIVAGELPGWDCRVSATADDILALFGDTRLAQTLVWQGRLRVEGDTQPLRRIVTAVARSGGSVDPDYDGYYTALARLLPHPAFTFMNHGYHPEEADGGGHVDLTPHAVAEALVERVTAGMAIEGRDLLDIGCGRGGPLAHVARRHRPRVAVGIDANPHQIELCRRDHRGQSLRFLVADACHLPLSDGAFDAAVSIESSHCYADRQVFLRELARVLRPGGTVGYVDVFNRPDGAETDAWLGRDTHFRIDEHVDLTTGAVRAIETNGEGFAAMLADMADLRLGNLAIITHLIREENEMYRARFVSGQLQYLFWRLTRTEASHVGH